MGPESSNCMRVLVTGANGYIGSRLVAAMALIGWEVHALVRSKSNLDLLSDVLDQISLHTVECDVDCLTHCMVSIQPSIIIHLASEFVVEHTGGQIDSLVESNIRYGTLLLEAAAVSNVKLFLNTGTVWEYWRKDDPSPVSLYAASKRAFEQILSFYESAHDFKVITLALCDTYGPADPRRKIINLLLGMLDSGETLKLSPGYQRMDFVHIDDVCAAFISAATGLIYGKTKSSLKGRYEVCTGDLVSLRELVAIVERASGLELRVEWGGRPYRQREVFEPCVSGRRLPDWQVKINIEVGILNLLGAACLK